MIVRRAVASVKPQEVRQPASAPTDDRAEVRPDNVPEPPHTSDLRGPSSEPGEEDEPTCTRIRDRRLDPDGRLVLTIRFASSVFAVWLLSGELEALGLRSAE